VSGAPSEPLDRSAREKLCRVLDLLADERASISSVTERGEAWRTHVDDSLTGLVVPELGAARRLVDVGAGAGFPGIPLAVALPSAEVDLVESVARKCEFMTRALEAAGIENARVLNTRSEELASGTGREAYDVVTARAVGRLSTLAELASPLLGDGGVLVAWKGRRDQDEEEQLQRAAASLAMREEGIVEVGFHAASRHRHLHVMRKVGRTPEGLPRRPGMAKKRPRG
jgi:16S rRNA (guanine527-N7)-methyltransferase